MGQAIGIDFGTSTSEVVVCLNGETIPIPDPNGGEALKMPSIVALGDTGRLLIGGEAAGYLLTESCVREVKRLLGSGEIIHLGEQAYKPEEVASLILERLKEIAQEALGQEISDVVLSVPANFADAARQATLRAASRAGLNVIRLLNEPTAAAIAFGHERIDREDQILVFDFGGGTLDISVIEMMEGVLDVRSSYGNPRLGGKDIDQAMVELLIRRLKARDPDMVLPINGDGQIDGRCQRILREAAEKAKIALSHEIVTTVDLPAVGLKMGSPVSVELELTRREFEDAIQPILMEARGCLKQAMLKKEIRPSSISKVLLVGGTTLIPAVKRLVTEVLALEPEDSVDPIMAVATGSAIWAATMTGMVPEEVRLVMTDVCSYGLGVEVLHRQGDSHVLAYEGLITPNETIPFSTKKRYALFSCEQSRLEVTLLQDHEGRAKLSKEALALAKGAIVNIPRSTTGIPHDIDIEFSYDLNGVAQVYAEIPSTRQRVEIRYDGTKPRDESRSIGVSGITNNSEIEQVPAGFLDRLARGAAILEESTIPLEQRHRLTALVDRMRQAITVGDSELIKDLDDQLTDALFDVEFS